MHGGLSFKCGSYDSLMNILALTIALTDNTPSGPRRSTREMNDVEKKAERLFAKETAWVVKDMLDVSLNFILI